MKKAKFLVSIIVIIIFVICAKSIIFASSGDVIGNIYSTDIKAYINGTEVPSYNIGGKTVIIVEDVIKYNYYNDDLRTLIVGSISPQTVIEGKNNQTTPPGRIVGKVYETDIKTYIYNKQLTSYSLNGKMAVAIEELGDDNTFSDIGGKFIWNEKERTISLEFMYNRYISDIMREKGVNMNISDNYEISFESSPIVNGSLSGSFKIPQDEAFKPLTLNDDIIGYFCRPESTHFYDDGNSVFLVTEPDAYFFYFYKEKVRELLENTPVVQPSQKDWLDHYENQMCTIIDSYETEDYIFLYMTQHIIHGSTQFLRRISKDGTQICYDSEFESVSLHGNKRFDDVVIDKENEKVTFGYDTFYEIDLKTGTMTKKQ